ncbi:alpha-actinin [Ophidiomyces ophidiicola]|nr:alpha-actinin [Ophidiomyces ophidiicola]
MLTGKQWVNVQEKTFTKWVNSKLKIRDIAIDDLVADLSDGVILIHILEILGNESLGRYASKPKLRVQKFENLNKCLDYIKGRGIQMTNIGAGDIVDGNRKIILGLIWTLILRFTISDINEEGMTAKEGLLLWCQRKTACYPGVEVRDFTASWNDGLAFCALLDIHRPDLIDFDSLDKNDHKANMTLAFEIASKEIGIPDLLDVEDVCDVAKPDERSLMTYIAYWFHAFSQLERVENAGRRVEKFIVNMQGAWEMQNSFERRMRELLQNIANQRLQWREASFAGTYADAKEQANEFAAYKKNQKRKWVAEKSDLAALLGNIKTKLSTYRLKPYDPPPELRLEVLDQDWASLTQDERERSQLINETIRDIKNALRRSFADKANDFALTLNTLSLEISGLEGDVEDQLTHVQRLNDNIPPLDAFLETIADLDDKCAEANIEENDFTTYTFEELSYELGLVKSSVAKKLAFLENQMVARNMTNLTPIQLEEFESVFRHFDRDSSNTLHEIEFSAALASLGLVYDENEMHEVFVDACGPGRMERNAGVSFEQFIRFMVSVTEDQNTAEQVFQSFREVADGKPYVTELDLRHSLIPEDLIENLLQSMPKHEGPDLLEDRELPKYDYITFMEHMMNTRDEADRQQGKPGCMNGGENDWVHDKFDDDRDTRPSSFRGSRTRRDGRLSPPSDQSASGAKLRINNLHYDITEGDLEDLFTRIGPIISLSLLYDRAGRSEGVAYVIYKRTVDAQTAIREFDGANAKGQPIRVTLVQTTSERPSRRNPFDFVEKPKGSLFDRAERPRDTRSLSPVADNDVAGGRGRHRRSDVSRPPPDNIDRYVPGQRSPRRDGGRSRARRPENRERNDSHRGRNGTGRPRKTQEELDQEMADYWAKSSGDATNGHSNAADAAQPATPAEGDDIDMIQ